MLLNQLDEHYRVLKDHKAGRRVLDSENEHQRLKRNIQLYNRKLLQMEKETPEEKVMRYEEMIELMHEMNSLDNIDFDATGI